MLKESHPDLMEEWNDFANKYIIDKNSVYNDSALRVWWTCNKGHNWQAKINKRAKGAGCIYCRFESNRK